jgi:subtilase family serine protease
MLMRKQRSRLSIECLEARNLLTAYTPAQISHAYGFDQLGLDGTGQTIAIVDAYDDPRIVSDLVQFDRAFGLPDPPSFTKVNQNGGTAFSWNDSWSDEISLDVEWAHAMAPGANILLVEANSATYQDLGTAIDYARNQPGVVAVSMSFGGGEFSAETSLDSLFTTPAGHVGGFGLPGGVTFVASTGDDGAPGGYPAYSPNVVAVGGTSLYLDDAGNYLGEVGWSGSGGGFSAVEPEPSYQYSVQATGVRTIPDVAYDADPNTGFWIYNTETAGGWEAIGGTSAGAPQWAALVALADEGRELYLGDGSLDGATQTLPALYSSQMSGDFNPVDYGYNGFYAGPGYDLVTGLGSPWVPWVASDLAFAGITFAAASDGAKQSPLANSSEGLTSSLSLPPSQGSEALIQAAAGATITGDAVFAESSMPPAMMLRTDPLSLETAVVDRAAIHQVQSTSEAQGNHSRVEQVSQLDLGGLLGLGSGEASLDASAALAIPYLDASKPA